MLEVAVVFSTVAEFDALMYNATLEFDKMVEFLIVELAEDDRRTE